MASTIRTLQLECEQFSVAVALRGASEKKDVSFDTASEAGRALKRLEYEDTPDASFMVTVTREVEVPPTGRQRKPRLTTVTERKVAFLPYEGMKIKGVRKGDEFFPIGENEVAKIEELTKLDKLTIEEFVPLAEVPWERAQACYYLAPPKGVGAKMLKTLHDAMESKGVGGVAKLMPKSRQKLALIHPKHGGLMVSVLAYADTFGQVVEGAAAISGVDSSPVALQLMETLIDLKRAEVSALDLYHDDLIDLKADLIERAKLGQPLTDEEPVDEDGEALVPLGGGDDSLLERLRASVDQLAKSSKSPSGEKVRA